MKRVRNIEKSTELEKAQARYYEKLHNQLFQAYFELFPTYAYIEDNAIRIIAEEVERLRKREQELLNTIAELKDQKENI